MPPAAPDHHDPQRFAGVNLADSAYGDDTGAPPPHLAAALAAFADGAGGRTAVIAALQTSRLLVPVVAVADEVEIDADGLAHDKSSDMAAVLMRGQDGRLALLAFTGVESLATWQSGARPVAVPARVAAQSALQDGAAALVIDLSGPHRFVVQNEDLAGLAAGWQLVTVDGRSAWAVPEGSDFTEGS